MDGPSRIAPETIIALTHEVAEAIVTWVFPDRSDEFYDLWPTVSGCLKSIQPRAAASSVLLGGLRANAVLEPAGAGAHVAILVAWAALQECNQNSVLPSLDEIRMAVESCAIRFGVDASMASRIAAAAAPSLFDLLAALPPAPTSASAMREPQSSADRLLVTWSDHWADCERDPVLSTPQKAAGSQHDILARFEPRREQFSLYVNEIGPVFYRPADKTAAEAAQRKWKDLNSQMRRFLWLILTAFETGQAIDHRAIGRHVFERRPPMRDQVPAASIRRVKSELNRTLGGLIDDAVRAEPGDRRYVVHRRFPFCWIRVQGSPSRLCGQSPT